MYPERHPLKRKYLIFRSGKAAVFLFFAIVFLLLLFLYLGLTQSVPRHNLVGSALLYLVIVVFYAFRIDRAAASKRR